MSASVRGVSENDGRRSAIATHTRAAEKGVSAATKETPLNPPLRGDVRCKYQISPALPQGARSLTEEEEEEDDDDRIQKSRMRKNFSSGNTKASTSLKGIA